MALITCKECGAQVSQFAEACPNCGMPLAKSENNAFTQPQNPPQQQPPVYQSQYGQQQNVGGDQNQNEQGPPPKTWLVESILVTLLCCLPFGIAGIVSASKVESRWYAGDKAGAMQASADAARWTKIGFFGGLIIGVLYGLLIATGVVNGVWEADSYYYY